MTQTLPDTAEGSRAPQSAESQPVESPAQETSPEAAEERAIQKMEGWAHRAANLAKKSAERLPAGVVVVVGGAVLLAADAFGVGEVITAGVAGYAAYRVLRRRARKRREREQQGRGEISGSASAPSAAE
jgi:hypothetical protein